MKLAELLSGIEPLVIQGKPGQIVTGIENDYRPKVIGLLGCGGLPIAVFLIKALLETHGARVGLIGSEKASFEDYQSESGEPESPFRERFIQRVAEEGGTHVLMELSARDVDLGLVDAIAFDGLVMAGLSSEEASMQSDGDGQPAPISLFERLSLESGHYVIINNDDQHQLQFLSTGQARKITYAIDHDAVVRGVNSEISGLGVSFGVRYLSEETAINTELRGRYNQLQVLAAFATGIAEGIDPEKIKRVIENMPMLPGGSESIDEGQEFSVVVDWGHTPGELERMLRNARQNVAGRIIIVFGADGGLDKTERALMGKIAARYSHFSIVTSDSHRNVNRLDIINDIVAGVKENDQAHYAIVPDRREAIRHGVYLANRDDMVLIAGKHQEPGSGVEARYFCDDRQAAREYIQEKERHE